VTSRKNAPEATSYVSSAVPEEPNYDFIMFRRLGPSFEIDPGAIRGGLAREPRVRGMATKRPPERGRLFDRAGTA
jgi:hypothetical protein